MAKPSLVTDSYWVYAVNPAIKVRRARFLAMWVMVIPVAELDATWAIIEAAVAAGKLPAARARTGMPSIMGFDERYKVICAATTSTDGGDVETARQEIRGLGLRFGLRFQTLDQNEVDNWA